MNRTNEQMSFQLISADLKLESELKFRTDKFAKRLLFIFAEPFQAPDNDSTDVTLVSCTVPSRYYYSILV